MSKIKIGVLGTGTIMRGSHLLTLRDHARADVVAAANHRSESLERLAADFNIAKRYTVFGAMAADPEIDAVVIALPNYLHAARDSSDVGGGQARAVREADGDVGG